MPTVHPRRHDRDRHRSQPWLRPCDRVGSRGERRARGRRRPRRRGPRGLAAPTRAHRSRRSWQTSPTTSSPPVIAEHRPRLLVLNAGATPHAATIQDQTWTTFSENWNVDVGTPSTSRVPRLLAPLAPGSSVVSLSSGAARMGSPMSGGYAGAKATIGFISAYAASESERNSLGIRFVALLPKLTPATGLGLDVRRRLCRPRRLARDAFLERLGPVLTAEQVGAAVIELLAARRSSSAYLLTAAGLVEPASARCDERESDQWPTNRTSRHTNQQEKQCNCHRSSHRRNGKQRARRSWSGRRR